MERFVVSKKVAVHARVNGQEVDFLCEARQSLLEILRDELRLTGTKEGCNNGNCGACNVILDGRLVNSCIVLAVEAEGRSVTRSRVSPVRRVCIRCSRSSLNMPPCNAAYARPASSSPPRRFWIGIPTRPLQEIRQWLAGNLCRCTGYDKIVRAVLETAGATEQEQSTMTSVPSNRNPASET